MRERQNRDLKPLQKIEQWEKVKLIEVLNLDEETAVRFFARRNEHQKKMKEILDQKDGMIQDIEDEIRSGSQTSDAAYKEQVGNILSLESRIMKERENFLKSLSDLFTPKQIATLVVFESKFRKEIRERLIERGRRQLKE
jgi:hypothetical protein